MLEASKLNQLRTATPAESADNRTPDKAAAPAADRSSIVGEPVYEPGPSRTESAIKTGKRGVDAAMAIGKKGVGIAAEAGQAAGKFAMREIKQTGSDIRENFRDVANTSEGRWVLQRAVNGVKAKWNERRIDNLQTQIDTSTDPNEQIKLVNKLEGLSSKRRFAAGELSKYFGDKMKGPLEQQTKFTDALETARAKIEGSHGREGLRGSLAKAEADLEQWKSVMAEKIANRDYGTPAERAEMERVIAHCQRRINTFQTDLASTEKVVGNLEAEERGWNNKYEKRAGQLTNWQNVRKDGKFGTSAAQLNKASTGSKKTEAASNVVPLRIGDAAAQVAERLRRAPKSASRESSEANSEDLSDIWDRVGAMIEESLRDLPSRLQDVLSRFDRRIQREAPTKEKLIEAWNILAKERKPELDHIDGRKLRTAKNNMTLIEFGSELEKHGFDKEDIVDGVERLAKAWERKIDKKAA